MEYNEDVASSYINEHFRRTRGYLLKFGEYDLQKQNRKTTKNNTWQVTLGNTQGKALQQP